MANQIAGTIIAISKREYQTRTGNHDYVVEVTLDASRYDQNSGVKYENYPSLDVSSQNFSQWQLKQGMRVRFDFDYRGSYFTRQDGTQGHMNNARAYRCEVLPVAQTQNTQRYEVQQPAQQYAPQAAPMQPQQTSPQPLMQNPVYDPYGNPIDNGFDRPPF